MSETSIACVKTILRKWIGSDDEKLQQIAVDFQRSDAVSGDLLQKVEFYSHLERRRIGDAIDALVYAIFEHDEESWENNITKACTDKDFSGESGMRDLLIHFLQVEDDLLEEITYLILVWDDLLKFHTQVFWILGSMSIDIDKENSKWPSFLLLNCMMTYSLENVKALKMEIDVKLDIDKSKLLQQEAFDCEVLDQDQINSEHGKPNTGEKGLEFRLVTTHWVRSVYICVDYYKFVPVKMIKHKSGRYFYCCLPKPVENVLYKYCRLTHKKKIWEKFLPIGSSDSQRCLILSPDFSDMIVHDVANFDDSSHSEWTKDYAENITRHLPDLEQLRHKRKENTEFDLIYVEEILAWTRSLARKPRITLTSSFGLKPEITEMSIGHWLKKYKESLHEGNLDDKILLIVSTLALVLAFDLTEFHPTNITLLNVIANCLSTEALSESEHSKLYKEIKSKLEKYENILPHSLLQMLKQCRKHCSCLFVLPLYWLIVDSGIIDKKMFKGKVEQGSLPQSEELKWSAVRDSFANDTKQKMLVDSLRRILKICEIHPWFISSYLYMLTPKSLTEIIKDGGNNVVVNKLPIDVMLQHLLMGCYHAEITLDDVMEVGFKSLVAHQQVQQEAKRTRSRTQMEDYHEASLKILNSLYLVMTQLCDRQSYSTTDDHHFLLCINMAREAHMLTLSTDRIRHNDILEKILQLVIKRIKQCCSVEGQLTTWNSFASVDWENEEFKEKWKQGICKEMSAVLFKLPLGVEFLDFYVEKVDEKRLNKLVDGCFNDVAFSIIDGYIKKQEGLKTLEYLKDRVSHYILRKSCIIKLFSKLFEKELKKTKKENRQLPFEEQVLKFLCDWPFSVQFYQLFDVKSTPSGFSAKEVMQEVAKSFCITLSRLDSRKIKIKCLNTVLEHREKLYELKKAIMLKKAGTSVDVGRNGSESSNNQWMEQLEQHKAQLDLFIDGSKVVKGFITACSQINGHEFKIDTDELASELDKDYSQETLCLVAPENQQHTISFYNIENNVLRQFQAISSLKDSKVFQQICHQTAVQAKQNRGPPSGQWVMKWCEALDLVWAPTKQKLIDNIQKIDSGCLLLDSVTKLLEPMQGNITEIESDLKILYMAIGKLIRKEERSIQDSNCPSSGDASALVNQEQRIQQICKYYRMQMAKDAVTVVLDIKKILDLTGNFQSIKVLQSITGDDQNITIWHLDQTIPSICQMDEDNLLAMKEFIDEEQLITWLMEKKMSGIEDVKVMCDLAMIAAGENPDEVAQVSCLLSAVMGFAPFLFELSKDSDLKELIDKCKQVVKNAVADTHLYVKWKDTGRNLPLFKRIEKLHGSVEKLSLTKAQNINDRGVYTIQRKLNVRSVGDVIRLQIPEKNEGEKKNEVPEVMNLSDLHDLQSKLILIAGEAEKGQKDVNLFIDVLSVVEKLAEIFVKLLSSGCMLFNEWSATIGCQDISNSHDSNNFLISITFSNSSSSLGRIGSLTDLRKISNILEETLKSWDDYIVKKYMEHYYLNEFNIQQITYLCHQLASLGTQVPNQVRTLLQSVSNNLSVHAIQDCLLEATKFLDCGDGDLLYSAEEHDEKSIIELKKRVVWQLVSDNEVDEDIAKAAVESEGYQNPSICLRWTIEHKFDEELVERLAAEFDKALDSIAIDVVKEKHNAVAKLKTENDMFENVAKAAVQSEGYKDLFVCMAWFHIHANDDLLVRELSDQFDKEAAFQYQEKEPQVITSVLYDRSSNSLKDVIERLVKLQTEKSEDLINSMKTICAGYYNETRIITLQDYVSVEHLGRFLNLLRKESSDHPPVRNLMPPLQAGKPNLIIRSEGDILPTVLSLYHHDQDQPLPSTFEVLLCSEQTKTNDVKRFMRRAMLKSGDDAEGKMLFSLAFADKLSFNVSTATEQIFNSLSENQRTSENYQLVILLSKSQHYLTACFDKYLVDGKWMMNADNITTYLAKHLKVPDTIKSATCVDSERSLVRVVSSSRSGVGKSLHVKRLKEQLTKQMAGQRWHSATIRLLEKSLNPDIVIDRLYGAANNLYNEDIMLIHLDLTPAVLSGVETFAFNLFILGSIQDREGKVWRRHKQHLYAVETTDFKNTEKRSGRNILNFLPCVNCFAPKEVLERKRDEKEARVKWLPMDHTEFQSEVFQRPFQYLQKFKTEKNLDTFQYTSPNGTTWECIETLLNHCSMEDPSWAQLKHFVSFLNHQLRNCENSVFFHVGDVLSGLKAFAVKFMIRMSQDFATPSLEISDESESDKGGRMSESKPELMHQLRRKWEESNHPYIFFNEDGITMTFINVRINCQGDFLDKNGEMVEQGIIDRRLVRGLKVQGVSLDLDFDELSRNEKLENLCRVMGITQAFDPDPTYELTTDNVLKILAIYMRFQCGIPVIIMGETGCGKTRMIEFMSKLRAGKVVRKQPVSKHATEDEDSDGVRNMITLKIHGGITVSDIYSSIERAQKTAGCNWKDHKLSTVLFYDEANTTEAIYAIKEVLCDLTVNGQSFEELHLQLVAACNPYKLLSKPAIKKLEDHGLGYRIRTSETTHLLGNIPLRRLVYRVVALPPSMQPFVWDFGKLREETEKIYIEQMTSKLARKLELHSENLMLINKVLCASQTFMRGMTDECKYVSLRDVERCMIIFEWFHRQSQTIYKLIDSEIDKRYNRLSENPPKITSLKRTLIQTVGVCYHASLDERELFRKLIAQLLGLTELDVKEELSASQAVFLNDMKIDGNIAHNEALQENVFMITICAETRIPLFLIGKPGSSKSLAKTIVMGNMEGISSRSPLYRSLKQVHILSYQCSALTDAVGISGVFKQCTQLQASQNLDKYVAVVVLDEIGLAEDSRNMPLKVLHPLLECGSIESGSLTDVDQKKKVGFVGISNWALDPAKMNRGISVTRNKPNSDELLKTAKGIFEEGKFYEYERLLKNLTDSYMEIYNKQNVEYFGLRDYYSLMKMINVRCITSDARLTFRDVMYAVLRNFSGRMLPISTFHVRLNQIFGKCTAVSIPVQKMIRDNLSERNSRFLLLLTNQYSAVSLLGFCISDFQRVLVVFGSSFPGDHSYTKICRNINRIKVCMETGRTVVMLNMTDIHESLYDALNQHYVSYGGQKYVDLGLGGHRVKCRIAEKFRLIVVELKDKVYHEYPIPLLNRLEKHHLDSHSLLTVHQKETSSFLNNWLKQFSKIKDSDFMIKDTFAGAHEDTASSVVLTLDASLEHCKYLLLQSCTMDGIFRLPKSELAMDSDEIQKMYISGQVHDSLVQLMKRTIKRKNSDNVSLMEIASYSNVLSENDRREVERELGLVENSVMLLSLEQFQTEEEYSEKLDEFFGHRQKLEAGSSAILLIQCSQAQAHGQLIAGAKYCLLNKLRDFQIFSEGFSCNFAVAFLLSTERESKVKSERESFILQHTKENSIIYVDELRPINKGIAPATHFYKKSLCSILEQGKDELRSKNIQPLVNMKSLLKDCVCEALAKLREAGNQKDQRQLKRINILTKLLSEDDEVSIAFQKVFLQKMIELYREREAERIGFFSDWIVEEACNRESLHEGGTFRKTLWLCLKRHISKVLAYVASHVDRSNNLDILFSDENWKTEMWLRIFEVMKMSWEAIRSTQEFFILNPKHLTSVKSCNVPFSFHLHELFKNHWESLNMQDNVGKENVFYKLFRLSGMHRIIANAFTDSRIVIPMTKQYIQDLIHDIYVPGSRGDSRKSEYQAIGKILFDRFMQKYEISRRTREFQSGDEIALVFQIYKETERFLLLLSQIIQACPKILSHSSAWIQTQNKSEFFVIHILALKDVLKLLEHNTDEIDILENCKEWMKICSQIKPLLYSILDLLDDVTLQKEKKEILKSWTPLCLLDLLILQLVPSSCQEGIFEKYLKAIAPNVKSLWKVYLQREHVLWSPTFLKSLTNILRGSYELIRLKILLSWADKLTCRYCNKRVKDPVIFPCSHFTCWKCAIMLKNSARDGIMICRTCSQTIPTDFLVKPAVPDQKQKEDIGKFQSSCTSLFLEYLHSFCFVREMKLIENQATIDLVLRQIVLLQEDKKTEIQKAALNLNINTRCCVLKILLNFNPEYVNTQMNDFFDGQYGNPNRQSLQSIVTVVLMNFEQTILDKSMKLVGRDSLKEWELILNQSWQRIRTHADSMTKLELLRTIAEIRCSLREFSSCITDSFKNEIFSSEEISEQRMKFIEFASKVCVDDETHLLKEYVIKVGCKMHGIGWFDDLIRQDSSQALIPPYLKLAGRDKKVDHWCLLGEGYLETNSDLCQTNLSRLDGFLSSIFQRNLPTKRLAGILAAITWSQEQDKGRRDLVMKEMLSHQSSFNIWMVNAEKNLLSILSSVPGISDQQAHTLYQLIVITAAAVTTTKHMMEGFNVLAMEPRNATGLFLPAMPVHYFFTMPEYKQKEFPRHALYMCPNGHMYAIGDCTKPYYIGKCHTCGATIGGKYHKAATGNQRVEMDVKSQAGYMLNTQQMGLADLSDRISNQGAAILHFLLHACMLIGSENDEPTIARMLDDKNKTRSQQYLVQQLQKNLKDLSSALGRNIDQAVLIMHKILLRILENEHQGPYGGNWLTLEKREEWETTFHKYFLQPIFQKLNDVVTEAENTMNDAEILGNKVLKLVRDLPLHPEPDGIDWTDPLLWCWIEHSSSSHLLQTLVDSTDGKKGEVLQNVLKTPNLHLVKNLESVLKLQKVLVFKYQNKLDLEESEIKTFDKFLKEGGHSYEADVERYIKAWNMIYPVLLAKLPSNKGLHQYFVPITVNDPISMGLPADRGRGQCAKILAEYLIDIQNDFLATCKQVLKGSDCISEVDISLLSHSHYVCIDKQEDIFPLIRMHTIYTITTEKYGQDHRISYNVDALEKQAREKFVMFKRLIAKNTLSLMRYAQDIGIGSDWGEVMSNTKQQTLTAKIARDVDRIVSRVPSADVCEGVRTLTHAISFLARVKEDGKKYLCDFLEKDLLLPESRTLVIPKSIHIENTIALYLRLSWHKSVNFARRGLIPYKDALTSKKQEDINSEIQKQLDEAFIHTDVIKLQQKLNEMLVRIPEYDPDWSMSEIFPYHDFLDENDTDETWYSKLPEEICFKHVSHLFSLAVEFTATRS